jgi:hypothetical protein
VLLYKNLMLSLCCCSSAVAGRISILILPLTCCAASMCMQLGMASVFVRYVQYNTMQYTVPSLGLNNVAFQL